LTQLSIVIPAYNEEKRLPSTLDAVIGYVGQTGLTVEILVVDDGSLDRTAEIVCAFGQKSSCVRLIQNPGNRGKGYAVRNGMLTASGEWILFSDADLSAPIEECEKLMSAVKRENAAVAIGSRALDRSLIRVHQPAFREYSGRIFNWFMRQCTGLKFYDTQCGFKLYRRDVAKQIFSRQLLDGFSFDVEDLVIAKALGAPAIEVPVRWNNVEGSKVSLGQGLRSFSDILLIRWNLIRGRYNGTT
jgi:glycosyltransferase involved in cell wall biosynthesis